MSDSATPWTVGRQAPLSMGFSRQEYWSGLPCLPPGIFPTQGSKPHLLSLLHWQAGSLPVVPPGKYYITWHVFLSNYVSLDLSINKLKFFTVSVIKLHILITASCPSHFFLLTPHYFSFTRIYNPSIPLPFHCLTPLSHPDCPSPVSATSICFPILRKTEKQILPTLIMK